MNKLVWQPTRIYTPEVPSMFDPTIEFDGNFVKLMLESKISPSGQRRMNELGRELIKRQHLDWHRPYSFYGDTCMIGQFNLGRNGTWLAIDRPVGELDLSKSIKYYGHNVDTPREACALLSLVNLWVDYSEVMRRT